ncbi:MAG: hypothetical protein K8U03_23170 [Planctomycetia bacterium]|nr:hypothetical protein [Planctomycetia bacterium]
MDSAFSFGDQNELDKRKKELTDFLDRMFDNEDRPYFMADEACLYDIYAGEDAKLSERFEKFYGRKLAQQDFLLPIWLLLDSLPTRRDV